MPKSLFVLQEYLNRKNSGNGYSIHQPQGNKTYGTEKSGFLLKKSDGCVKTLTYAEPVKYFSCSSIHYLYRVSFEGRRGSWRIPVDNGWEMG